MSNTWNSLVGLACLLTLPLSADVRVHAAVPQDAASLPETVASAVEQRYVFPEIGPKIAAVLREQARKGAYRDLNGGPLADALTRDLRTTNGDRHLYVTYQAGATAAPGPVRQLIPPGAPAGAPAGAAGPVRVTPGSAPGASELTRRRNFFLNQADRLDGNIGYLDIRQFNLRTDEARDALTGAMAFLAQTDAMILDVRYAPGGDAGTVDQIVSYFYDKVIPTLATYSRSSDRTIQRTTLESVPGKRRPAIPLFVLTSRDTGSAAEDFSFLLRETGRATLVGDRTAGAGHTNAILNIGGGYSLSVSIGRTFNPKTNQGWEGDGVQPHVRVPAPDALVTAHRLALTALIEQSKDASQRQELIWTRDALDARVKPVVVDAATLARYAGQYGVRRISTGDGRLWYQRADDAERIPLTAVSATDFAMGEGQRFQFVVQNGVVEMRMLNPDGTFNGFPRGR